MLSFFYLQQAVGGPYVANVSFKPDVLNALQRARLSRGHIIWASPTGDTQEDWEREMTCWRERGEGVGGGAKYYGDRKKDCSSINYSILSVFNPYIYCSTRDRITGPWGRLEFARFWSPPFWKRHVIFFLHARCTWPQTVKQRFQNNIFIQYLYLPIYSV